MINTCPHCPSRSLCGCPDGPPTCGEGGACVCDPSICPCPGHDNDPDDGQPPPPGEPTSPPPGELGDPWHRLPDEPLDSGTGQLVTKRPTRPKPIPWIVIMMIIGVGVFAVVLAIAVFGGSDSDEPAGQSDAESTVVGDNDTASSDAAVSASDDEDRTGDGSADDGDETRTDGDSDDGTGDGDETRTGDGTETTTDASRAAGPSLFEGASQLVFANGWGIPILAFQLDDGRWAMIIMVDHRLGFTSLLIQPEPGVAYLTPHGDPSTGLTGGEKFDAELALSCEGFDFFAFPAESPQLDGDDYITVGGIAEYEGAGLPDTTSAMVMQWPFWDEAPVVDCELFGASPGTGDSSADLSDYWKAP